jgi:hypothetical protein
VNHPSLESWCNGRFSPGSLVSTRVFQFMNRYSLQFPRGELRNRCQHFTLKGRRSTNGMKDRPLAFILPLRRRPILNLMLSYSQLMKLVRDLLSHAGLYKIPYPGDRCDFVRPARPWGSLGCRSLGFQRLTQTERSSRSSSCPRDENFLQISLTKRRNCLSIVAQVTNSNFLMPLANQASGKLPPFPSYQRF